MNWKRVFFWISALLVMGVLFLFHPSVAGFFQTYPIPAGAIMAAIITVSGVLLSNWDNTRRLRLQLDHDRLEKSREREFKLRQEVYLEFLGQAGKLKQFLGKLQSLEGSDLSQKLDGDGLAIAAAQVNLCAGNETSKSIGKAGAEYALIVMRMLLSQAPYYSASQNAKLAVENGNEIHAEVLRIQANIALLQESGRPDQRQLDVLNRAQEFRMKQHAESRERLDEAHQQMAIERMKFPRVLQQGLSSALDLEAAVVNAMRTDLGIETKIDSLAEDSRATLEHLTVEMEAMIKMLQKPDSEE